MEFISSLLNHRFKNEKKQQINEDDEQAKNSRKYFLVFENIKNQNNRGFLNSIEKVPIDSLIFIIFI